MENTATNELEKHRAEMVVLAVGVQPPEDMKVHPGDAGACRRTSDGFYLEAHPKLQPVDSATRGIFFAGCAEGPKDIKDAVTQASAAAARAMRLMNPKESAGRGDHGRGDPRRLHSLRDLRQGLSVRRDHRGYQSQDPSPRHRGGLLGVRHLRGRMPA